MKWVLLDVSWLAYRALHAMGDLEHGDVPTGVIFGFFHELRRICLDPRVRSNRVAVFCDTRTSFRAKVYPEYKAQRREERDEEEIQRIRIMRTQVDHLTKEVLPKIGFPVYAQEGLESDDLLAYAARQAEENGDRAVIITSDADLLQCVSKKVIWFDPQRDRWIDRDALVAWKGVGPHRWAKLKCLAGCSSDNVAGVPGVGETTAVKYLLGELPPRYKAFQNIVSSSGRKVIKRNKELVVLPHKATTPFKLTEPTLRPETFFRYCERYALLSMLREKPAWTAFLSGALFRARLRGGK